MALAQPVARLDVREYIEVAVLYAIEHAAANLVGPRARAQHLGRRIGAAVGPAEFLRLVLGRAVDARIGRGGRENAHADVAARQFVAQSLANGDDAELGDRVGGRAHGGADLKAADGGGIDDVAALAMLADARQKRAHAIDDAMKIDADDPFPFGGRDIDDVLVVDEDARVVANNIDASEFRFDTGGGRLDRSGVGNIGLDADGVDLQAADILDRRIKWFAPDIEHGDLHAFAPEHARHAKANAGSGARDHGDLALEIPHARLHPV